MQNIIKKAIEGGYEHELYDLKEVIKRPKTWKAEISDIVCDPLFWQALGKIKNWDNIDLSYFIHKFFEKNFDLTQGWDKAVEYLEEIIK